MLSPDCLLNGPVCPNKLVSEQIWFFCTLVFDLLSHSGFHIYAPYQSWAAEPRKYGVFFLFVFSFILCTRVIDLVVYRDWNRGHPQYRVCYHTTSLDSPPYILSHKMIMRSLPLSSTWPNILWETNNNNPRNSLRLKIFMHVGVYWSFNGNKHVMSGALLEFQWKQTCHEWGRG